MTDFFFIGIKCSLQQTVLAYCVSVYLINWGLGENQLN